MSPNTWTFASLLLSAFVFVIFLCSNVDNNSEVWIEQPGKQNLCHCL